MVTLYGQVFSRASRCMWALAELDIDYEHVPVGFDTGETQTPDFLAINPNGRIPALVDGDLSLFESIAINLHLAKSRNRLWPQAEADQARVVQWSIWGITEVETPLLTILVHRHILPADARDPNAATAAEQQLVRPLRVLDQHLAHRDWLVGAVFGIADLNVAAILKDGRLCDIDFSRYPNLHRWLDACLARPAIVSISEQMHAALAARNSKKGA